MERPLLAVIVGSNRRELINRKLAQALIRLGADKFDARLVCIDDLPMFNQDNEGTLPAEVVRFKDELARADGILIVTPEHDRSISRSAEKRSRLGRAPVGQELLGRQTRLHHRHFARRDRHGTGAAAFALRDDRARHDPPRRRSLHHL